nr:MAG TPA: hypothetical protein [Caudoviricetes sp.]
MYHVLMHSFILLLSTLFYIRVCYLNNTYHPWCT